MPPQMYVPSNVYKIIIDQKDTHVHFRLFVNHALSGKLIMQAMEYVDFERMMTSIGCVVESTSFTLRDTRLACQKGRPRNVRKLHQSPCYDNYAGWKPDSYPTE